MKLSAAVFSFLVFAAVFGSQAWVIHDPEIRELAVIEHQFEPPVIHSVFHSASDCCYSYTSRTIRCANMKDYFSTSSGCSQPAVIFLTNKGQRVCANPLDSSVQECMTKLKQHPTSWDLEAMKLA